MARPTSPPRGLVTGGTRHGISHPSDLPPDPGIRSSTAAQVAAKAFKPLGSTGSKSIAPISPGASIAKGRNASPGCVRHGTTTPGSHGPSGNVSPGGVRKTLTGTGNSTHAAMSVVDAALQKSQQLLEELTGLGLGTEDNRHVEDPEDLEYSPRRPLARTPLRSPRRASSVSSLSLASTAPEFLPECNDTVCNEDGIKQWDMLLRSQSASSIRRSPVVPEHCHRSTSPSTCRRGIRPALDEEVKDLLSSTEETSVGATYSARSSVASTGTVEMPFSVVEDLWHCLNDMEAATDQEDVDKNQVSQSVSGTPQPAYQPRPKHDNIDEVQSADTLTAVVDAVVGRFRESCPSDASSVRTVRLPAQLISELHDWLGDLEVIRGRMECARSRCRSLDESVEGGPGSYKVATASTSCVTSSGGSATSASLGAEVWPGSALSESPPGSPSLASADAAGKINVSASCSRFRSVLAPPGSPSLASTNAAARGRINASASYSRFSSVPAASLVMPVSMLQKPPDLRAKTSPVAATPAQARAVTPHRPRLPSPRPRAISPCLAPAAPVSASATGKVASIPGARPGLRCRSPRLVCRPVAVTNVYNVLSWEF